MNWNRIISGLIAAAYIVFAGLRGGAEQAFKLGIFVIFPLACIWFPDATGGYVGPTLYGRINSPSPGILVLIFGWLLLFLPILLGLVLKAMI